MLEDYILSRLPLRDVVLFRRLRRYPYSEWHTAITQLLHDGELVYQDSNFIKGEGIRVEGTIPGWGKVW